MPLIRSVLTLLASGAAFLAHGARAQVESERWQQPFFGTWGTQLGDIVGGASLTWWTAAFLPVALVGVLAIWRLRRRRRALRRRITGLPDGPRFRMVDAMCHAVWAERRIDPERLRRAADIARDTTGMDFHPDRLRDAAMRVDRGGPPPGFRWMRHGLTPAEKMVIFNATISVLLADGPLSSADRKFLRRLVRGLGIPSDDLGDLNRVLSL
ncbi:hypothetical protein JAN5088_00122 [Jannaschia rubra]|uniref:Tellurite resistance protein TerB n=1 Tax=Jannaschia rubra TaxID=282197 RepID=A0A0M6XJN3_9RHOB|nr:hypothetical protein JAN5088_00122 [Jannaschia rubra]SFF80906.1 hypothetical protein SAMN04488517_101295 [Jannaschia rubra]